MGPRARALPWVVFVALAAAVFVLQARALASWLIDDAGISFAYAKNLALGFGLVSQPGAVPVEGYSDPLWVLLLAPFLGHEGANPLVISKGLSVALVLGSFALMAVNARALGLRGWAFGAAVLLTAVSAPFVIWSVSGLENPLTTCCVLLSVTAAARSSTASSVAAALAAVALALCRPDAAVYLGAMVLLRRRAAMHLALVLPVVAALLALRWATFGDLLPNTFRAKVGAIDRLVPLQALLIAAVLVVGLFMLRHRLPVWRATAQRLVLQHARRVTLVQLVLVGLMAVFVFLPPELFVRAKPYQLGFALAGRLGPAVLVLVGLGSLRRLVEGTLTPTNASLAVHLLLAATAFVVLPRDWMPEARFATPAIPLLALLAVFELEAFGAGRWSPMVTGAVLATLVALAGWHHVARLEQFSGAPTVPFAELTAQAERLDWLTEQLGLTQATAVLPDIGGVLFASRRVRVFDLAGLCDRDFARLQHGGAEALREHLFEEVKPTFVRVHSNWTRLLQLDLDPRFAERYVEIESRIEPGLEPLRSGLFVRRDVLGDRHLQ